MTAAASQLHNSQSIHLAKASFVDGPLVLAVFNRAFADELAGHALAWRQWARVRRDGEWSPQSSLSPSDRVVLLGVPILIHVVLGVKYLFTAKFVAGRSDGSVPTLRSPRNRAYKWQRITSWILLIGSSAMSRSSAFSNIPRKFISLVRRCTWSKSRWMKGYTLWRIVSRSSFTIREQLLEKPRKFRREVLSAH